MSRISQLLEFIKEAPDDSFLQHALALEYIKIGDDATAEDLFNNLLLKVPDYVGSYYHLGKLLERRGNHTSAINLYKQGMKEAKKAGDNHSYNELRGAFEDLES